MRNLSFPVLRSHPIQFKEGETHRSLKRLFLANQGVSHSLFKAQKYKDAVLAKGRHGKGKQQLDFDVIK